MAVATGAIIGTLGAAAIGAAASRGANKAAARASNASADAAGLQSQIAAEQWDKYQEIYDPLERQVVKEAQQYDTPENYARAAGDASATVASQFGKAREQLMRTPGLDPSSGAYQAGLTNLGLAEAANSAVQQNAARMKVKDTAFARKTDALSLGKGLPANASSALGSAAATNNALATFNTNLGLSQAGAAGRVMDRITSPNAINGMASWLKGPQAGSMNGNGSVQGNADYVYDL